MLGWFKEKRQQQIIDGYTQREIANQYNGVSTRVIDALELGAVEIASGIIGRSFINCMVEGDEGYLTPECRAMIARELVRRGEIILFEEGGMLMPSYENQITGSYNPSSWQYQLTLPIPTSNMQPSKNKVVVYKNASNVLHFRQNCEPARPWKGRSVLEVAKATTDVAKELERQSYEKAKIPNIVVLGVLDNGSTQRKDAKQQQDYLDGFKKLSKQFNKQGGSIGLMPLAPGTNLQTNSTEKSGSGTFRKEITLDLIEAMGIPRGLLVSSGTGSRESFRQLLHLTLEPMAKLIGYEILKKTGMEISFDFSQLYASDLASRGRALKQLVDAGLGLDEALMKAGLN